MYPENKVLVAPGVYGVEAEIDGTVYKGVANCGARPTFGEDAYVMEAYFEGLSEDLYGKEITVKFLNYIRGIKKFESAEELSEQIAHDVTCIGRAQTTHLKKLLKRPLRLPPSSLRPPRPRPKATLRRQKRKLPSPRRQKKLPQRTKSRLKLLKKPLKRLKSRAKALP